MKGVAMAFVCAAMLSSCGVTQHQSSSKEVETSLFDSDFKVAMANIDQDKFLMKDRNRLLYLMEKGKIEHLSGHYEKSNEYFEQAYIMLDDKIKSSAGQFIAGKFTNAMAEPYKGEDFEKVTIHYYKALNYFQLGKPEEALVEAKRINIKLNALNDKYEKNKNKYSADAFSQIVQGVLYESIGDVNNAFIAYRNAEELYSANNDQYFGVPLPDQLKKDLIRTSRQLGFTQELNAYQKRFNMYADPSKSKTLVKPVAAKTKGTKKSAKGKTQVLAVVGKPKDMGEVIVFWENGLGPVKGQTKITVSGVTGGSLGTFSDEANDIIIPIPAGVNIGLNAIAIPKYLPRESYYKKASFVVDGKEEDFDLSQDFYNIAKQCLKDRMMREAIDIAVRLAAKKAASKGLSTLANHLSGGLASNITSLAVDAANVATEKADTRNWRTLPATISYARIPLKEGNNNIAIKKYGANGIDVDTIHVNGKPGLQVMSYFDLGRTISAPAIVSALSVATPDAVSTTGMLTMFNASNASKATLTTAPELPIPVELYDKWIDGGKNISYMVTYQRKIRGGINYFIKTLFLKNMGQAKLKAEYSITEAPIDDTYKAIKPGSMMVGTAKTYTKFSKTLDPGKEVVGTVVWNTSPLYTVTFLKVE